MKRYSYYCSALAVLETANKQDITNEFVQGGIIDKFFLQFELGWKVFKDLLAFEGAPVSASGSPRDIIKAAFRYFGFMDEELWLGMLRDRNNTAHVYDKESAARLVGVIINEYVPEFQRVRQGIEERYEKQLDAEA